VSVKTRLIDMARRIQRNFAIRDNVTYGPLLHIGPGSILWAPRSLVIGSNVYIGRNVTIQVDGEIGDEVLFANNAGVIGRDDHDVSQVGMPIRSARWVGDYPSELSRNVTIGSDVWVGFGAIVLSGVVIGDSTIVAAGAVVTGNLPANSIAAGVPARVIRPRFTEEEFTEHWRILAQRGVNRVVP